MKVKEYMKLTGLQTSEDLRQHFIYNLRHNKIPVAMYSCPKCGEILLDSLICPICSNGTSEKREGEWRRNET